MAAAGPVLSDVRLRPFQAGDEAAFRRLNEEWIAAYFGIEEKDRVVLSDPFGEILKPGGAIFMADRGDRPVGCCALLWMRPYVFEVAKMAVEKSHRGFGIGRKVLEYTIAQAKARSATRLYLETNNKLANAIHLYASVGFGHVPPERVAPSPYARANVFMEMVLQKDSGPEPTVVPDPYHATSRPSVPRNGPPFARPECSCPIQIESPGG